MEFTLRCNTLKCRKEIANRAVVTTCRYARRTPHSGVPSLTFSSHVFCIDCANQLQLAAGQRDNRRPICPACDAHLPNPDDIIITNLNPTEDYKTSVLSGLSPNVIMECASRALAFWAYQATQEMFVGPAVRSLLELTTAKCLPRVLGQELDRQVYVVE